jgi:hypothetical protein
LKPDEYSQEEEEEGAVYDNDRILQLRQEQLNAEPTEKDFKSSYLQTSKILDLNSGRRYEVNSNSSQLGG